MIKMPALSSLARLCVDSQCKPYKTHLRNHQDCEHACVLSLPDNEVSVILSGSEINTLIQELAEDTIVPHGAAPWMKLHFKHNPPYYFGHGTASEIIAKIINVAQSHFNVPLVKCKALCPDQGIPLHSEDIIGFTSFEIIEHQWIDTVLHILVTTAFVNNIAIQGCWIPPKQGEKLTLWLVDRPDRNCDLGSVLTSKKMWFKIPMLPLLDAAENTCNTVEIAVRRGPSFHRDYLSSGMLIPSKKVVIATLEIIRHI